MMMTHQIENINKEINYMREPIEILEVGSIIHEMKTSLESLKCRLEIRVERISKREERSTKII